jgi:hypothetical protein
MSKQTFQVNTEANTCGTCLQTKFVGNYAQLVGMFGEPIESDGYKVSGEWVFESEDGDVITVYDWKETSMYDDHLPSVDQFRSQQQATFHVGGRSRTAANDFVNWLMDQLTKSTGKI